MPRAQGWRFFADDEDEFGLEDVLQALCFVETGSAFCPPKPWECYRAPFSQARRARSVDELSEGGQRQVELLLSQMERDVAAAEEVSGCAAAR